MPNGKSVHPLLNDADWLRARYHDERLPLETIAKMVGSDKVTKTTVRRALIRHGIPTRNVSEAMTGKPSPWKGTKRDYGAKVSAAKKGKPSTAVWTPEMRAAHSEKLRVAVTPEARAKLSAERKGAGNPMFGTVSPSRRHDDYHPDHRERQRRASLRHRFGMTGVQYAALLAYQDGVCAICHKPEWVVNVGDKPMELAVDHNHATGAIRGLLCRGCNVNLGRWNDDPVLIRQMLAGAIEGRKLPTPEWYAILRAAIDYLADPPYARMLAEASSA